MRCAAPRKLLLLAATLLPVASYVCMPTAYGDEAPRKQRRPRFEGYTITVDNGSGEIHEVQWQPTKGDEKSTVNVPGNMNAPGAKPPQETENPEEKKSSDDDAGDPDDTEVEAKNLGMKLPDGRMLPFYNTGKVNESSGGTGVNKAPDENVIADAALQRMSKREENLSTRRYNGAQWNKNGTELQYTDKKNPGIIELSDWQSKFSVLNHSKSESVEVKRLFTDEEREKRRLDRKDFEYKNGPLSPWSRDFSKPKGWDERMSQDLNAKFLADDSMKFEDRLRMQYKNLTDFSMQDINRYHFNRNRQTAPGLNKIHAGKGDALKPTTR